MPELPEVEVTRRSFAQAIAGARIESVCVGKPLRWPLGCDPQSLVGKKVIALRRIKNQHTDIIRHQINNHKGIKVDQKDCCALSA